MCRNKVYNFYLQRKKCEHLEHFATEHAESVLLNVRSCSPQAVLETFLAVPNSSLALKSELETIKIVSRIGIKRCQHTTTHTHTQISRRLHECAVCEGVSRRCVRVCLNKGSTHIAV